MTSEQHGAPLSLDSFLEELTDESKTQSYAGLAQLSGLAGDEAAKLDEAWGALGVERKRGLLERLVELAEDNAELDFRPCVSGRRWKTRTRSVRQRAVQGLWESDDRTLIAPLAGMLANDPAVEVRTAAAMSLGRFAALVQEGKLIATGRAAGAGVADAGVRRRRRGHGGAAQGDRGRRLVSTRPVGDRGQSATPTPAGTAGSMQSAVYAMGQSSNADWLRTVLEETGSGHSGIRYEATVAAGKLGDEEVAPRIALLLLDDDQQVRIAAVRALGEVGGQTARRALKHCLEMEDELLVGRGGRSAGGPGGRGRPVGLQV